MHVTLRVESSESFYQEPENTSDWNLLMSIYAREKQPQKSLVNMWVKPVHFQMISFQIKSDGPFDSTSCEFHQWISAKLGLCPTSPSRSGIQNHYWLWTISHNPFCLRRLLIQFVPHREKDLREYAKLLEKPVLVKMWLQILSLAHNCYDSLENVVLKSIKNSNYQIWLVFLMYMCVFFR